LSARKLPDYRLKQKILYIDNTGDNNLINYGDLFLAEGKIPDAFDFYKKAKYSEGIDKIITTAMNTGDTMLYGQAMKALNKEPVLADWEKIGQKAIALKKYFFAKFAWEKAGKREEINSLLKNMEAGSNGNEK